MVTVKRIVTGDLIIQIETNQSLNTDSAGDLCTTKAYTRTRMLKLFIKE